MALMQERHPAVEQFERDGCVIFREVLDPGLIQEASHHVEWLMRRHPDHRPERLGHDLMTNDPFWVRLISDARLLDIAARICGVWISPGSTSAVKT